jgi:hypothetical protein
MRVVANTVGRLIGLNYLYPQKRTKPLRSEYVWEHITSTIDANILTLLASAQYIHHSHDSDWLNTHKDALVNSYEFYRDKIDDRGLIGQPAYSDWQDSLDRSGHTTYTNLLHLLFLTEYAYILGIEPIVAPEDLKESILLVFGDDKTWLLRARESDTFSDLDSQLIALRIWDIIKWNDLAQSPLWTQSGLPWGVSLSNNQTASWTCRFVGLGSYHKELRWSWIIGEAAKVCVLHEQQEKAEEILQAFENIALRDGTIGEIYDSEGNLFRSLLYRSETPFSWWCARILEAVHTYRQKYN